jgi:hypothetical protein
VKIKFNPLLDFCVRVDLTTPTIDLRPAGYAWLDAMIREITINGLVEQSIFELALRRMRAWPDQ